MDNPQLADTGIAETGISPSLRGAISTRQAIDMNFCFRYVDTHFTVGQLGETAIRGYLTLDLLYQRIELSLAGQNLPAQQHLAYVAENQTVPTAIVQGVYDKTSWNF
ncbi:MAG: hypothetical protein QX199_15830 [Methylococcaceae bacterium]